MQTPAARLVGIIPINRLDRAKSRLSAALSPDERAALVLALAERTQRALRDAGKLDQIVVVSPDDGALAWAESQGAIALRQPDLGLNAGLALARDWATEQGAGGMLVALGDLPLLTADEVRRFVAMTGLYERIIALAPDRAGAGTNLMLARPAALAPLAYGRASFARHRRIARRAGMPVVEFRAPGAAFDVDTPADLQELIERGLWQPARSAASSDADPAPHSATQPATQRENS
ncbi:MAG TPA: 2-phospho-L-lactate guanylyltransferase [Ktedonobacterales bacterium]